MDGFLNAPTNVSEMLRLAASAALVVSGGVVSLLSVIGLLRFPDFYTRLRALALGAALGAPILLGGLAIAAWDAGVSLKLLLLGGLMAAIAPAASHILAS